MKNHLWEKLHKAEINPFGSVMCYYMCTGCEIEIRSEDFPSVSGEKVLAYWPYSRVLTPYPADCDEAIIQKILEL